MLIDINGFDNLNVEEQRGYILTNVGALVVELAKKYNVDCRNLSTQNILRNLKEKTSLTSFSKELLETLIELINIMQNNEIDIIRTDNSAYHRVPLFCYGNDGNLKNITVFEGTSNLTLCISLLSELERKRILPDKETKRRLLLK